MVCEVATEEREDGFVNQGKRRGSHQFPVSLLNHGPRNESGTHIIVRKQLQESFLGQGIFQLKFQVDFIREVALVQSHHVGMTRSNNVQKVFGNLLVLVVRVWR